MGPESALGNNRSVTEKDTSAYVQLDLDADRLGRRLRTNAALRYVDTKETATGYSYVTGGPVAIARDHDYTDILPSLNAAWDLRDDFFVRLAVAKVMARPNLGNLNPGASASVSGNSYTVTIGNAELEAYRATTYDTSFEWYFDKDSLLSLALFYKDINTFVQTIRETRPFSGNPYNLPDSVAITACGATPGCDRSATWSFNVASNTPGGAPFSVRDQRAGSQWQRR